MKYKAILFDFDGTLLNSDPMLEKSIQYLYDLYRPGYRPPKEYFFKFSGPPITESLKEEFPGQNLDEIYEKYLEISPKFYQECVTLYEGARELIYRLKEKGIKVGLITSKRRVHTDMTIKQFHLEDAFDITVTPDEAKEFKPSPESINYALRELNLKKDEAIYVGDSLYDFLSSKNAGVDFALVSWSPRKSEFEKDVKFIISHFDNFENEIE